MLFSIDHKDVRNASLNTIRGILSEIRDPVTIGFETPMHQPYSVTLAPDNQETIQDECERNKSFLEADLSRDSALDSENAR